MTMRMADLAYRYQHALDVTMAGFAASLQYVPDSPYRRFCAWAIEASNPHREAYLQLLGIKQLVMMTVRLLDGLVDAEGWERLVPYCAPINAYLTYEVFSDNLAIGLARSDARDTSADVRRRTLHAFNSAMIDRLAGDTRPAAAMLAPLAADTRHVSLFDASLTADAHRALVERYVEHHPSALLGEIEASVWPLLVANIETCSSIVAALDASPLQQLVQQGLIRRYAAVNRLVAREPLTLAQRAAIGTDAILVAPTLAYYVAVLAAQGQAPRDLTDTIQDGSLPQALTDAALLVRLLNDLGSDLLTLPVEARTALQSVLTERYHERSDALPTLAALIMDLAADYPQLTRLEKDLVWGEFNVGIDPVRDSHAVADALAAFETNVGYYAELYQTCRHQLTGTLHAINTRLRDTTISQLIMRFVRFHEIMYGQSYQTHAGEYAI